MYTAADKRYRAKSVKRVPLDMLIRDYERLQAVAAAANQPINTYIKQAISDRMQRETGQPLRPQST